MKRIAAITLILTSLATPSFADQVVRATWYGNELRGHRTASGEMFNPGGRTVAHKIFEKFLPRFPMFFPARAAFAE
jgi:rare lipoprotein A (peptidoglycan hydrolase)